MLLLDTPLASLPGEPLELDFLSKNSDLHHDTLAGLSQFEVDTDTAYDSATVAAATVALNVVNTVVTWDMVHEATSSHKTFRNLIRCL